MSLPRLPGRALLVWAAAVLGGALLAPADPACALATFAFTARPPLTSGDQTAVEVMSPRGLVLRVRGADPSQTSERAQQLVQRLNYLLDQGATGDSFALRWVGQAVSIAAGNVIVLTVSAADAAANATTVEVLAQTWLARLRQAFAQPYFAVGSVPLIVPLQGEAAVPLLGPLASQVTLMAATENMVAARRISPAVLVLQGLFQGQGTATFTAAQQTLTVPVSVLPLAAQILPAPTIRLSGPGTEEEVRAALAAHLRDAVSLKPGSSLTVEGMSYDQELLGRTGRANLFVGVVASGPGFASLRAQVTFLLERGAPPQRTPLALWVSNDPESLRAPAMLLHGEVPAHGSVRLFFHHVNAGGSPLALVLWAFAPSGESTLYLLGGGSRPQGSPIGSGGEAVFAFLRALRLGQGFFVKVSGARPLLWETFEPGETTSGLYEVSNDSGERVGLLLEARLPNEWSQGPLAASLAAPLSRHFLFPAQRRFEVTYRVGEDWGALELGRQGELGVAPRLPFRGNYGVVHRIRFRALNSTSSNTKVELACYAGGGKTLVVYQLDGSEPRATPLLPAYGEARLTETLLRPGEERIWEMVTVPVGGCFYPVSLLLRPVY